MKIELSKEEIEVIKDSLEYHDKYDWDLEWKPIVDCLWKKICEASDYYED
jgi:hypothetical protein